MFNYFNVNGGYDNPFFSGIKIYENHNCLEDTEVPLKQHIVKPWMSDNYHKRIQKKWIKRWGYVKRPVMYKTQDGSIICHPTMAAQLRAELMK